LTELRGTFFGNSVMLTASKNQQMTLTDSYKLFHIHVLSVL